MLKRKRTAQDRSHAVKRARTTTSIVSHYNPYARGAAALRYARLGRGPIPNKVTVTLKYVQLNSSNGAVVDQVFNINSMFDPDRTGTGHQPLGFDQYSGFFNKYRVYKCKVTVQAVQTGTGTSVIGLLADNVTSAYAGMTNYLEQPGAIKKPVIQVSNPVYISRTYDLWKVTGKEFKEYMSDDIYAATFAASPSENILAHVGFWTVTGGTVATDVLSFVTTLEMTAELFDPIPLGSS